MNKHPLILRKRALFLRKKGLSLQEISKTITIPKTTIASWLIEDPISNKQKEKIRMRGLTRLRAGRIRAQRQQRKDSLKREKVFFTQGISEIGRLKKRELFLAGVALYWAEGFKNKHEHRLGFCNSDVNMIKFYITWLEKILNINKQDLVARVTVNIAYKRKIQGIQRYWSQKTGIPVSNFSKPFYQNTKWKKEYKDNNYYGVLRIHINKSMTNLLKMRGWIKGLSCNMPG